MEDEDPPINAHLRKQAMEMSIQMYRLWHQQGEIHTSPELQIQDIIYVAKTFYNFLKGDTK